MRKPVRAVMTGVTAVVLGVGIRAGATHGANGAAASAPSGVVAVPRSSASAASPSTSTKVNGTAASTQYGPVQVQITIRRHRIVRARAIDYPQGSGTDQQINGSAIPQLDSEVVQTQSARIDTVSGATYTSDGYLTSLQSALDHAASAGLL